MYNPPAYLSVKFFHHVSRSQTHVTIVLACGTGGLFNVKRSPENAKKYPVLTYLVTEEGEPPTFIGIHYFTVEV